MTNVLLKVNKKREEKQGLIVVLNNINVIKDKEVCENIPD